MRANVVRCLVRCLVGIVLVAALATCASRQKPFEQMTALEHHVAAEREHRIAEDNFERVRSDIVGPDGEIESPNVWAYGYGYDPYEIDDPEAYIGWPRVDDPSEKFEDAASAHREKALRHERAAAALEGRPSPQPLPPPQGAASGT